MLHKKIIFLILTTLLTSCNFHLRGPMALAPPLQQVYVQAQDPYGSLTQHLKQYLKMSGAQLAQSPDKASAILNISQESSSQDLVSINSSQQTRQYSLKLTVTFDMLDPHGNILLSPQMVTETRPLTLQSNQVLASSNEAAQLYQNMRRTIVYAIMTRLASPVVSKALLDATTKTPS